MNERNLLIVNSQGYSSDGGDSGCSSAKRSTVDNEFVACVHRSNRCVGRVGRLLIIQVDVTEDGRVLVPPRPPLT